MCQRSWSQAVAETPLHRKCPECEQPTLAVDEANNPFYPICTACGHVEERHCPHDHQRCRHRCIKMECWREVDGS